MPVQDQDRQTERYRRLSKELDVLIKGVMVGNKLDYVQAYEKLKKDRPELFKLVYEVKNG